MVRYYSFLRILRSIGEQIWLFWLRIRHDVFDLLTVLSCAAILLGLWYICFWLRVFA